MIDDLLDVGRIISGKLRLDVQRVDVASVIEEAVTSAQPAADAKGIRLIQVLGSAAFIEGDPGRLQQVVWNLVSNAIKFTRKGGKVQVTLRKVDSHVEVEVSDTGVGIRADVLPHVFQRFRQADAATPGRQGGLGLGLAIVKNLVEMHGGSVTAASAGEGARQHVHGAAAAGAESPPGARRGQRHAGAARPAARRHHGAGARRRTRRPRPSCDGCSRTPAPPS